MRDAKKVIDINAHIENLKCEVVMDNAMPVAKISFDNLGDGVITAIKFDACGYNSFGDIVPINGKEKFFLIIQDISILKNEMVNDLKAKLPNADIKKLVLTENQICYADGTVATYEGENSYDFDIEEFDINTEREQFNALKKMYDERMKYVPKDFEQGWICGCGRFNKSDHNLCSCCSKMKSDTIHVTSPQGLKELVEKYHMWEDEERRIAQEKAKLKEKEERNKKIGIGIGIVCAIALIVFIVNASIMSKRETYDSVDEMRSAMQGTWSHDGYNSVLWQIQIEGDTCTRKYEPDDEGYQGDITWNPSKGTFTVRGTTYIVQKGGRSLMEGNYDYRRGGTLTASGGYS